MFSPSTTISISLSIISPHVFESVPKSTKCYFAYALSDVMCTIIILGVVEVMSELSDYMQCAICQDTYIEPKQLSCGHAFCEQCLSGTQSLYSINCAMCRKATYLSVPGIQGVALLPTNYPLAQIVHQYNNSANSSSGMIVRNKAGETECSECHSGVELSRAWLCSSCDVRVVCGNCVLNHHRLHSFEPLVAQPKEWQKLCKQFDKVRAQWSGMQALTLQVQETCANVRNLLAMVEAKECSLGELVQYMHDVVTEGDSLRFSKLSPTSLLKLKQAVSKLGCAVNQCNKTLPICLKDMQVAGNNIRTCNASLNVLSPKNIDNEAIEHSSQVQTVLISWNASPQTQHVRLAGSFTGWRPTVQLMKHATEFVTTVNLPKGKHQIKFVVDDEWRTHASMDTVSDANGGFNNILQV